MRAYLSCITIAILFLFISSCSVPSATPLPSIESPAATMNTPIPSTTAANTLTTALPASTTGAVGDNLPGSEPQNTGTNATAAPEMGSPGLFNEETFSKYFQFGMSMGDVEKKLKSLGIGINEKMNDDRGYIRNVSVMGFWKICTDHIQFNFDKSKRLYEMDIADWETAKGYVPGDSPEKLHQLYGKEDDLDTTSDIFDNSYVYYNKDCYFSVQMYNEIGSYKDSEPSWSVYVDVWNDPHLLDKGVESSDLMAHKLHSDEDIMFNEENFSSNFPLGMSQKQLVDKLNSFGVRITDEWEGGWTIRTDHVSFFFFSETRLDEIDVSGWPTTKGLNPGDPVKKLHQLYGKESDVQLDTGGDCDEYTYFMNGYPKSKKGYQFILDFGDYNHPQANALSEWEVCNGK